MSISAVIITHNEEDKIRACLKSVWPVSDEVIIVDAESLDSTVKIAKEEGAKVFIKKWEGYSSARNYGAQKASNNWILSIDSDEQIDEYLTRAILQIEFEKNKVYSFRRINNYCGRWMKYGALRPEWKQRLYHREEAFWNKSQVHEKLEFSNHYEEIRINGSLLHYSYDCHEDYVHKLSIYSTLQKDKKKIKGFFPSSLSTCYHFLRYYIFHLGFLEGYWGFKVDLTKSRYHGSKY